jgi:hypothetical protein
MTLAYIHMKHLPELRLTELLLALIRQPRITFNASQSQTWRVENHYPPLHDRVPEKEKGENQ